VNTLGSTPASRMVSIAIAARSHCPPFAYAVTSALNVTTLGSTPSACIAASAASARSHCPPLA
jgi:hypothetical protein